MKTLVVVRCGDNSLHPEWVNESSNFDVVLSYFGNDIQYNLDHIKFVHNFKGSKWQGLYDFFLNYPDLWQEYDYIWLPDDDLSTTAENLNIFFDLCHQYQFILAQPALTKNSYFTFGLLLQVSNFIYRETNFVEVMAPCFSKEAFKKVWQTFSENKSGWGLDALWPVMLENNGKIGIIDAAPVFHTRPVGVAGHGLGSNQESPYLEKNNLLKKYKIVIKNGCFSGLLENNQYIQNKKQLFDEIVKGVAPLRLKDIDSFNKVYNEVFYPEKSPYIRPRWKKILGVK
ncbi:MULTISPECIES: DUF707 domain-containing protein [Acinetobacter]|uniref:DUF707 domain-containing protein n=1 Tax=Acinetobacter corruptisaponis TaxID=3045147 RepID=A0ABY8S7A6_9GAMM|nr:DUF707 domain-containing protein [Acinetobacter sp. KCTC 92772]WHP07361.1 DUF707 domain-containing protein [Acinetobacter sp. KCTC 92772]